MASHEVYNKNNKLLSKIKLTTKTKNILKKVSITFVAILFINWVIALTTNVNFLGTGISKLLEAIDIYDHAIPSISFSSDDWSSELGSWHINKSAKWTDADTAEVVFNLNTTKIKNETTSSETIVKPPADVIFVIDNSLSMNGNKLDRVKEVTSAFIKDLISETELEAALISFDDDAYILSDFSRDQENLLNKISSITAKGNTNYNDALTKVNEILKNYEPKSDRVVYVFFLSDGVPCIDTPNEVDTYHALKEKYDYLTIYGIGYETGSVPSALSRISDLTTYATRLTLEKVFDDEIRTNTITTYTIEPYEKFEVVDYVNDKYFYIKDQNDIKVERGTVKLDQESNGSQKITWTLDENFKTGDNPKMTIKLTLKDQYVKDVDKDFYPTNKKEEATGKLKDKAENTKASTDTPVLQRIYNVIYDYNPPTGCNIQNETSEKHYAFESVEIKESAPVCANYLFKGWEIVTENITKLNDDYFVMPEKDVTLRAAWGKMNISKSMKGTSGKKPTLYEIAQADARSNDGARIYEGEVTDQYNNTVTVKEEAGTSDGIYYYTSKTHNNVIFAGFCWQMVRTTATGGVKIVYNGVPVNGTCKDDRGYDHIVGTDPNYHLPIISSYLYGDSYTIDADTGEFTLTGNVQRADTFAKNDLIGKYTCYDSRGTNCDELYQVNSLDPESSSYTYATEYEPVHYANIGNSPFNSNGSLAYVGYMYNTVYEYKRETIILDTALWGNGVEWKDNAYHLTDPITGGIDDNHHYTCATKSSTVATDTCTEVRYYYSGSYYITLQNGTTIEQALTQMLSADNVNTKDSDIKKVIDAWYEENMTDYTKYLEDTVFCNDRSIEDLGGWDPNGGSTSSYYLQFNNYSTKSTHVCPNETDQFAVGNSKAQLTYPVGLLTAPEESKMGWRFAETGERYWLGSPGDFSNDIARERRVNASGSLDYNYVNFSNGVRSAVSLNPGTKYTTGAGTVDDPYIVWPVTK